MITGGRRVRGEKQRVMAHGGSILIYIYIDRYMWEGHEGRTGVCMENRVGGTENGAATVARSVVNLSMGGCKGMKGLKSD